MAEDKQTYRDLLKSGMSRQDIRKQIIAQRKGTTTIQAEKDVAERFRKTKFSNIKDYQKALSRLPPSVRRRVRGFGEIKKQQQKRLSQTDKLLQEAETKQAEELQNIKEKIEKYRRRDEDERQERYEDELEERQEYWKEYKKGLREGKQQLEKGNIIQTKKIKRFARDRGSTAERNRRIKIRNAKARREARQKFKEKTGGISYEKFTSRYSPGAQADILARRKAEKEGISKEEAQERLIEEGTLKVEKIPAEEQEPQTEKLVSKVETPQERFNRLIFGDKKQPRIEIEQEGKTRKFFFVQPEGIELGGMDFPTRREVQPEKIERTTEGAEIAKFDIEGYKPTRVKVTGRAESFKEQEPPKLTDIFKRDKLGGLKGVKALAPPRSIQKLQQKILLESDFGTPTSALGSRAGEKKFLAGATVSGLGTLAAVSDPVGTVKSIPASAMFVGERIISGKGFPEVGRIIRQEPEFAAGFIAAEAGQAYLGGKLFQQISPRTKIKTKKTKVDSFEPRAIKSKLRKKDKTPLSKTFADDFYFGKKGDKVLTRLEIPEPSDIRKLALKRAKEQTRIRKATAKALERPKIARAERIIREQLDEFRKSPRGKFLERQKKAKAFKARKAQAETPVKFEVDDFYKTQAKKRLETGQDIFVLDSKTGRFKKVTKKPRFKKKRGEITVKKAGSTDEIKLKLDLDDTRQRQKLKQLREKQREKRFIQQQEQKSKQVQEQVLLEKPKQKTKQPIYEILSPEEYQKALQKQRAKAKAKAQQKTAQKQAQKQFEVSPEVQRASAITEFVEKPRTRAIVAPKLRQKERTKQKERVAVLEREATLQRPKTKVKAAVSPKQIPKLAQEPKITPKLTPSQKPAVKQFEIVKPVQRPKPRKKKPISRRKDSLKKKRRRTKEGILRESLVLPVGFTARQTGISRAVSEKELERLAQSPERAFAIRGAVRKRRPSKKTKRVKKSYELTGLTFEVPKKKKRRK